MTPEEKKALQDAIDAVFAQDVVVGQALSLILEHLGGSDAPAAPVAEIAPAPPADDAPKSAKEKK